jgi:hypothetical protein
VTPTVACQALRRPCLRPITTASLGQAADGLRRWQAFLDQFVYGGRWPVSEWSDFPPAAIRDLMHAAL